MFNCDYVTKEDIKIHNSNWSQILDYPYKVLIAGGSGFGKRNVLLNIISHQPYILCAKDPYEVKYQLLINKRESGEIKHYNYSKALIEYSNDMNNVYTSIEEDNTTIKRKISYLMI